MIASLATLAVRLGVPERFAPAAVVVALIVVLAVLALLLAKGCYDDSLSGRHDAERDADLAEQGRAADSNAAVARREDDARLLSRMQECFSGLTGDALRDSGLLGAQGAKVLLTAFSRPKIVTAYPRFVLRPCYNL